MSTFRLAVISLLILTVTLQSTTAGEPVKPPTLSGKFDVKITLFPLTEIDFIHSNASLKLETSISEVDKVYRLSTDRPTVQSTFDRH